MRLLLLRNLHLYRLKKSEKKRTRPFGMLLVRIKNNNIRLTIRFQMNYFKSDIVIAKDNQMGKMKKNRSVAQKYLCLVVRSIPFSKHKYEKKNT